jgi:hypothetical protein
MTARQLTKQELAALAERRQDKFNANADISHAKKNQPPLRG